MMTLSAQLLAKAIALAFGIIPPGITAAL